VSGSLCPAECAQNRDMRLRNGTLWPGLAPLVLRPASARSKIPRFRILPAHAKRRTSTCLFVRTFVVKTTTHTELSHSCTWKRESGGPNLDKWAHFFGSSGGGLIRRSNRFDALFRNQIAFVGMRRTHGRCGCFFGQSRIEEQALGDRTKQLAEAPRLEVLRFRQLAPFSSVRREGEERRREAAD